MHDAAEMCLDKNTVCIQCTHYAQAFRARFPAERAKRTAHRDRQADSQTGREAKDMKGRQTFTVNAAI